MMPRSTSRSAVSTSRAKNGAVPTTSGKMTPRMPSDVPVTMTVMGISTMSRMMKGTERMMLSTKDRLP